MAQRVWRRSNRPRCHWHFVSWWQWSLGITIDWVAPNLEVHLPFGFLAIGWEYVQNCVDDGRWVWQPDAIGDDNEDNDQFVGLREREIKVR